MFEIAVHTCFHLVTEFGKLVHAERKLFVCLYCGVCWAPTAYCVLQTQ
jgi:hypothetical protein